MARKVKISTIGARPLSLSLDASEGLVEGALSFWQAQFDQVLPDQPDLIVVPEMCDSYGDLAKEESYEYYVQRGDRVLNFFAATARRHKCYITYPAVRLSPNGKRYNSLQLLDRNGEIVGIYDKNHVVIDETLEGNILCGNAAPIFECDFGRVACAVCFDLNFDALRLQYVEAKPDLILFPSMFHGGLMQNYWAYSCRSHFVSAISSPQLPSNIISPVGEVLAETTNYLNFVTSTINLDCRLVHFDCNWGKLGELKAQYGTEVTVKDPGRMGSVLVSSDSDQISVDSMLAEFEIELLDDYLARSLRHHKMTGNCK